MSAPAVESGGRFAIPREVSRGIGIVVDAILLILVVLPPALAVASVDLDPTLPFDLVVLIALAGLVIGILFSFAPAGGKVLHPIALVAGVGAVVYLTARILPDAPPEATTSERVGDLANQLISWLRVVIGGGQATNNLLFLLLLALIAWLVGYFGAWAVFRERSAWWPVTVSATALTLVLANFPSVYGLMLFELTGALLLIGRVNLQNRQDLWTAVGLRQPGGVGFRGFQLSLLLALLIVALTWIAPAALSSESISESLGLSHRPWQQAQAEFNRLFGGLQGQNDASQSGFGQALTLHGAFNLTDTPVLRVQSPKPEYWRAVVYDQYTHHGWLSSDPIDQRVLPSGADVLRPPDQQRTDLVQQMTVLESRGQYLVGASQPVLFNQQVRAEAFADNAGGETDLIAVLATQPVTANSQYTVISSVSTASEAELRQASTSYPAEVSQRYLTLPPIPGRVQNLAVQLTTSSNNPYDKAVAVETYLRSLPYSLNVPDPPPNQDGVDYFLFVSKTGYCDYFASAMAVMLRSVGIPARVVSGYATGQRQPDGSYLVKDSDSHTWVEAYFPPYGWIPFEPSGSWPRFERGNGASASSSAGSATPTPQAAPTVNPVSGQTGATPTPTPMPTPTAPNAQSALVPKPAPNQSPPLFWLILLALVGLAALLWYLWEKDLRNLPPPVASYARMARLARLLGIGPRLQETPIEFGSTLAHVVPEAGSSPARLAEEYARYRFGGQSGESPDRLRSWWRFVRNAMLRRIGRLRR